MSNNGLSIVKKAFGETPDGPADLYLMRNDHGMEVEVTNFGGIIVAIRTPDKTGKSADVVLGFDELEGYLGKHPHFGTLVGRYGNRIGNARFSLDGKSYQLAANNGDNHLHGGLKGFGKVLLKGTEIVRENGVGVQLTYLSKDMEEGYPGNLEVSVDYLLTNSNELQIEYRGITDKPTVVNLTNHSYFNLAGEGAGDVLKHLVRINADHYTPVDEALITTGEIAAVDASPFDFRKSMTIGARIESSHIQMQYGNGYDHNFVLNRKEEGELILAATVFERSSGRTLEVHTTEPGVQFYTGNFLDGSIRGKGGKTYERRFGFCLETQHYPDSPNKPDFPSTELRPGGIYQSTTVFKFGVRGD